MPKVKRWMEKADEEARDSSRSSVKGAWQMWHRNGTSCPKGTVPIRQSSLHDVLRAKSLFHFGKKQRGLINPTRRTDAPDIVSGNGHEVRSQIFLCA